MGEADTRGRLLEAAGRVFADRGYEQTTVRDICDAAGANVAAVSYHFGGKAELYRATMRHFVDSAEDRHPMPLGHDGSAERRLGEFVRVMLRRIFDDGPCSYHGKLMARELLDPTDALDEHVEAVIRPLARHVSGLVAELTGLADPLALRRGMESVLGQIIFQKHGRPVFDRLYPRQPIAADTVDALADHITAFSLAGLRAMAETKINP